MTIIEINIGEKIMAFHPNSTELPYTSVIRWFHEDEFFEIGNKAANIAKLRKLGIKTPEGFAVSKKAFLDFIVKNGVSDKILALIKDLPDDIQQIKEINEKIIKILSDINIHKEMANEIINACHRLRVISKRDIRFATRSSSIVEDVSRASFAGLYDTFLQIDSDKEILESVKKCWQSAFGFRALVYMKNLEFKIKQIKDIAMAILIQEMINSKFSGVMFTVNPVTGDPSKVLIEYSIDPNKSVVSGEKTPNSVLVDKITNEISQYRILDMELEKRYIYQLTNLGKQIELYFGCYQDIEWIISEDSCFQDDIIILQARPETVWNIRHQE